MCHRRSKSDCYNKGEIQCPKAFRNCHLSFTNLSSPPTDPEGIASLLNAIDGYEGALVVKYAMKLSPLLIVMPGELRHAEWAEIDFAAEQWGVPAQKMKMRHPYIVPLSHQVIAILRELHSLTGHSKYVFPEQAHATAASRRTNLISLWEASGAKWAVASLRQWRRGY
jgi:integrase